VIFQPLLKVVRILRYKPDDFLILQADDEGVDGKDVGRQFCRVMVKTREAGGESIHTSMV